MGWLNSKYRYEDKFQEDTANLLRQLGLFAYHVPNGGKRTRREGAKLKKHGVLPGVLDWIVCERTKAGRDYFRIELKAAGGQTSPAQKAFIAAEQARGISCYVVWTIQEFIDCIKQEVDLDL